MSTFRSRHAPKLVWIGLDSPSPILSPERAGTSSVPDLPVENEVKVSINRIHSEPAIKILCQVDGMQVQATVESGAQVSVISERFYRKLHHQRAPVSKIKLQAAGEDQVVEAMEIGPVLVELGEIKLNRNIYVAPIFDDMLLGLDILIALKAKVNLDTKTLECRDAEIPLEQASLGLS